MLNSIGVAILEAMGNEFIDRQKGLTFAKVAKISVKRLPGILRIKAPSLFLLLEMKDR